MNKEDLEKYIEESKFLYPYDNDPPFTHEEEAYRRGYSQGFAAARNKQNQTLSVEEIYAWRNSKAPTCPPGSKWAGKLTHPEIKDEEFFIVKLQNEENFE